MTLERARKVLEVEAAAIAQLARQLDAHFEAVVGLLANCKGRVICTGMGKSGIICRKVAATLASTGTPAFFLHPAEAIHGDLGMIVEGDTVLAVSNSGETEELIRLLTAIKRQGAILIAITGKAQSTLATHADYPLVFSIDEEGCPLGLAPMASTTTTLAMGDALAAALMERKGFTATDFAKYHPGGKLGADLVHIYDVVHKGEQRPLVQPETLLSSALVEMSAKRLGMTAVALPDRQIGIISDGDIRRLLQAHGQAALNFKAGDVCTPNPKTINAQKLAVEALKVMETHHITSLIAVKADDPYFGVVHLHDLWHLKS